MRAFLFGWKGCYRVALSSVKRMLQLNYIKVLIAFLYSSYYFAYPRCYRSRK